MNKKILIGCVFAVLLIVSLSFSSSVQAVSLDVKSNVEQTNIKAKPNVKVSGGIDGVLTVRYPFGYSCDPDFPFIKEKLWGGGGEGSNGMYYQACFKSQGIKIYPTCKVHIQKYGQDVYTVRFILVLYGSICIPIRLT